MRNKIYLPTVRWWEEAEKKGVSKKLILLARAYEYILSQAGQPGTPLPHVEYYNKHKPMMEQIRRENISRTMRRKATKKKECSAKK